MPHIYWDSDVAKVLEGMAASLMVQPDPELEKQLDAALVRTTRLLLLDEPCCNLSAGRARSVLTRVARWLDAHPKAAAVCVAHAKEHVPPGFDRQLVLPATAGQRTSRSCT